MCLWVALSTIAAGPVPARAAETEDGKLAAFFKKFLDEVTPEDFASGSG